MPALSPITLASNIVQPLSEVISDLTALPMHLD